MCQVTDEIKLKSKGVYHGLVSVLDQKAARQATKIWINEYSQAPLFAVRPFIDRLYTEFKISETRAELQRNLLASLMTLREQGQLEDIPGLDADIERVVGLKKVTEVKQYYTVFKQFIDEILKRVKAVNEDAGLTIRIRLLDKIGMLDIHGNLADSIKHWMLENRDDISLEGLNLEQMKGVFHQVYVSSCELIGPVPTDEMIAEITHEYEEGVPGGLFIRELF